MEHYHNCVLLILQIVRRYSWKITALTNLISLKDLVYQKSKQFQELLQAEAISVTLELEEKEVLMSKYLADILLNNLFSVEY